MHYSRFQKLMLLNAHPAKILFNLLGGGVICFLLLKHDILSALIIGGILIGVGTIIANKFWKIAPEKLGKGFWGKVTLRFTPVIGFVLYLVSHVLVPLAFWSSNYLLMLAAMVCYAIPQVIYKKKFP